MKDKTNKKLETSENAQAIIKEKRKELLNELHQHKGISIYAEQSFNSYIPPKNLSLSLNFHIKDLKEYKKYISESDAKINYHNPVPNPNRKDIYISYDEPPFIIDEKTDLYIINKEKKNQDTDIIQNIKKENINKLKKKMILYFIQKKLMMMI